MRERSRSCIITAESRDLGDGTDRGGQREATQTQWIIITVWYASLHTAQAFQYTKAWAGKCPHETPTWTRGTNYSYFSLNADRFNNSDWILWFCSFTAVSNVTDLSWRFHCNSDFKPTEVVYFALKKINK